jgi:hypothetical protein
VIFKYEVAKEENLRANKRTKFGIRLSFLTGLKPPHYHGVTFSGYHDHSLPVSAPAAGTSHVVVDVATRPNICPKTNHLRRSKQRCQLLNDLSNSEDVERVTDFSDL